MEQQNNTKPLIKKRYNIPLDMFAKAFITFQKKYVYPKNIIISILFGVIMILYIIGLIREPSNTLCYLLIGFCVVIIITTWLNVINVRKKLMSSISEIEEDVYDFTLYGDCLSIQSMIAIDQNKENYQEVCEPTVIYLSNKNVKASEYNDYYILYIHNRMFYIIPKKDFSNEENKQITEIFKERMENRFS